MAATVRERKLDFHTLEEFYIVIAIVSGTVGGAIFSITPFLGILGGLPGLITGFFITMLLSFLFIRSSIHNLKAEQNEKAAPKIFGKIVNRLIGPGWIWIPFKGLIFDYVSMNGHVVNLSFTTTEYLPSSVEKTAAGEKRVGDRSQISITNDIRARIDPENPAKVFEVGGFESALELLREQLEQCQRIWIYSSNEGPQTIDQAQRMGNEAIRVFLMQLLEDDIHHVAGEVPSEAILGFLTGRRLSRIEEEWLDEEFHKKTESERHAMITQGKKFLGFIEKARNGQIQFALPGLGLIIERLVIGNIQPTSATAAAMSKVNEANFDAERRIITAKGYADAAKELSRVPGVTGDPLRTFLITENKIGERIDVKRIEASDSILAALEKIAQSVIAAFATSSSGKK